MVTRTGIPRSDNNLSIIQEFISGMAIREETGFQMTIDKNCQLHYYLFRCLFSITALLRVL